MISPRDDLRPVGFWALQLPVRDATNVKRSAAPEQGRMSHPPWTLKVKCNLELDTELPSRRRFPCVEPDRQRNSSLVEL